MSDKLQFVANRQGGQVPLANDKLNLVGHSLLGTSEAPIGS